jgi:hypothetical protein
MTDDKEMRALIQRWLDRGSVVIDDMPVKTSLAKLRQLSGFEGVSPYHKGINGSITLVSANKLWPIINAEEL